MPKLRSGSEAAATLLKSHSSDDWEQALESYEDSIKRLSEEKGRSGLVEVDRWWREDLPTNLRSRAPEPYITKEELVKVVQWKMWKGVVRPNLLRFAGETDPAKVEAKSREAFRHLPTHAWDDSSSSSPSSHVTTDIVKKAVNALTSDLKGVGPATASAVLAALCGRCCFDADEIIDAVMMTGVRKYTLPEYLKVQEALDDKAKSLGSPWDAERVRKALWSCAMHSRFGLSVAVSTRGEAIVDSDAHAGKEEQDCAETVDGSEERSKRHKSRR